MNNLVVKFFFQFSTSAILFGEFVGVVGCRTEYEGWVPMKAYNLVLSRFFKASVSVTL